MSCERYKKTLIETAASGSTSPTDAAGEHLSACTACREFLEREQALFAAIDRAAHRISNNEMPRSLLPSLQAALAQQNSGRSFAIPVWAYAFAAAAVALIILTVQNWRQPKTPAPDQIARAVTPGNGPSLIQQSNTAIYPALSERDHRFQSGGYKFSRRAPHAPEVLVQPDEEVQLIRFYEAMQAQAHRTVVVQESDAPVKPLAIARIEIAQLDIKNLFERGDVTR